MAVVPTEPTTEPTTQPTTEPTVATDTVATETVALPFDGPPFDETADALLEPFALPIGQPFSVVAVADLMAYPADAPSLPTGTITGVFRQMDLDSFDDSFDDEWLIGTDAPGDQASLQSFFDAVPADGTWTRASSAISDPYTTLLFTNAGGLRHVIVGNRAPGAGEASAQYELTIPADAVGVPSWLPSVPVPTGGVVTEVSQGVGAVDRLGVRGGDGYVGMRVSYPPELANSLIDQLSPGLFLGAGFELVGSPLSNLSSRVDVRMGEWEGTVGIGEVTSGDQLLEVQVIYSFRRIIG